MDTLCGPCEKCLALPVWHFLASHNCSLCSRALIGPTCRVTARGGGVTQCILRQGNRCTSSLAEPAAGVFSAVLALSEGRSPSHRKATRCRRITCSTWSQAAGPSPPSPGGSPFRAVLLLDTSRRPTIGRRTKRGGPGYDCLWDPRNRAVRPNMGVPYSQYYCLAFRIFLLRRVDDLDLERRRRLLERLSQAELLNFLDIGRIGHEREKLARVLAKAIADLSG